MTVSISLLSYTMSSGWQGLLIQIRKCEAL